jgi:hypothetical protein
VRVCVVFLNGSKSVQVFFIVYACISFDGQLQAKVALLVATEGEKNETSLIFPNFNYFLTQTSYLQDSN